MKRFIRIIYWSLLAVFGLAACVVIGAWFVDSRQTNEELVEEFQNQAVHPVIHSYHVGDQKIGTNYAEKARTIRFIETPSLGGDSALPVVLFIHGAPVLYRFLKTFLKIQLCSIGLN